LVDAIGPARFKVFNLGDFMSNLYWLNEDQMARLRPQFPKSHGVSRVDDRRVLSGIIFINRNGLRGCDAPKEYCPHFGSALPLKRLTTKLFQYHV